MDDLNARNGEYTLDGIFTFTTDKGELTLTAKDALEITYTLFDWAGKSYAPVEEIEDEIEKRYNTKE